jgi:tetratricopeptide (TPR) repeat protein
MTATDEAALQHALADYDAGQLSLAVPSLEGLSVKYPGNYIVLEALGGIYAESGDSAKALPYLKRAVALAPGEPIAHANLGAAYLKLEQARAAADQLKIASQLDPRNVQANSNLGRSLMLLKQPREAALAFHAANALQPGDATMLYNEALAWDEAKAAKQASEALEQIPAVDRSAEVAALAAEIAEQLGDYKRAVEEDQTAVKLEASAQNIYNLTVELMRHWSWDEAYKVAEFGAQRFPEDRRFAMASGISLFGQSRFPQSAHAFNLLLAGDPDNATYADLLGRSCESAGDEAAQDCAGLQAFAAAHPANAQAAVYAATKILQRPAESQDRATAERLLKQAVVADPELAEAYYQLAVLDQQRSQWQQSVDVLDKAVALRPGYSEAHYRLSRAYAHLGRREDAQREIALQQEYSQQEKDRLNARLQEVVLFLLKPS